MNITEEMILAMIEDLDRYARGVDLYAYGLPTENRPVREMVAIVRRHLTAEPILLTAAAEPPDLLNVALQTPNRQRTRPMVRRLKSTVYGCCERHADNMACGCMTAALPCPTCHDSGYAVHPQNGRRVGVRCQNGCPVSFRSAAI